ncbi:MAG: fibronectin type III domain-containing protein [Candidatus Cloacimonetes bacterium]|nr:fibronectin type III domain-containing protein [Candidatus Cloacimonadota bacterium]
MNKFILAFIILNIIVLAFAAPQRDCYWQVDTNHPAGISFFVNTSLPAHDPDFLLTVECSAYPGEIYSSADGLGMSPQVGQIYGYPVVRVDQQPWLEAWPAGSTLTFTLTYLTTGLTDSNSLPVPAGSAAVFYGDLFGGDVASWFLDNIFPSIHTVYMDTNPQDATINGHDTPYILGPVYSYELPDSIFGTYTPDPYNANGYWIPANLIIDANTTWVEDPVDSNNYTLEQNFVFHYYTLEVTSSPSGHSVYYNGVDTGFDTPHTFIDPIPGSYSLHPSSFNWDPAEFSFSTLDEDMNIHFVSEPKFLQVGSSPSGQTILKNGISTGFATPYVFSSYAASELAGTYSMAPVPGGHWLPPERVVTEAEILASPTGRSGFVESWVDERDFSLSISFDLDWYSLSVVSGPSGAIIHVDGADTGYITPHIFDPPPAGDFTLQKPGWTWEPEAYTIGILEEDTEILFVGSPPAAPSNLNATTLSSSSIELAWTDNSINEEGFQIERKTGSTGSWTQIASVDANVSDFTNSGLTQYTTYYYRVRAYCSDVLSEYSNEASATTLYTTPAAPTNLSAEVVSASQVDLVWSDNSGVETSYLVERKTGSEGSWSQIANLGSNISYYSNTGLMHGNTYFYRVRALNVNVYSTYSNEAEATPILAPTADFNADEAEVLELVEIQFTDVSQPGSGNIVSWLWDFGDGNSSQQQNPLHAYQDEGCYSVSLSVTNSFYATDTMTKIDYITVLPRFPVLSLSSADGIDFGLVWLGTSGSMELTLANTGTSNLMVYSSELVVTTGPFELESRTYPIELAPGDNTALQISFTPNAAGDFSNIIQIASNSQNLPLASLSLYATSEIPQPQAPEGVVLNLSEMGATLNWEPVTETVQGTSLDPSYYFIYRCAEPYGDYELFGVTQGLSYSLDLQAIRMLYHVKAVKFYRAEDEAAVLRNWLHK